LVGRKAEGGGVQWAFDSAEIGKLHIALTHAAPGEARKPIYAEIRTLKKLLARMDKMLEG
jgi:hypothetical protein